MRHPATWENAFWVLFVLNLCVLCIWIGREQEKMKRNQNDLSE